VTHTAQSPRPTEGTNVSRSAKHRKTSDRSAGSKPGGARHRKPSPVAAALQNTPGQVVAVAAGAVLIGAAVTPAIASLSDAPGQLSDGEPAAALHPPGAGRTHRAVVPSTARSGASDSSDLAQNLARLRRQARRAAAERAVRRHRREHHATVSVVYENPLRDVSSLYPERVDQGVDFSGSGPVFAIGDGVVTSASGTDYGWPGGGWITYQLTDGPAAGEVVYVAENVTPAVVVGEHVTPDTVIANMYEGADGIETGWAMLDSGSAESQLPEAGGISGGGPFPTLVGLNFDQLLQALGVPAAPNADESGSGILPSRYPVDWAAALGGR